LAIALAVLLSACAAQTVQRSDDESLPRLAAEDVIASALTHVTERYIEPVPLDVVGLEGMRGLGAIDPVISVEREGERLVLAMDGDDVAHFPLPARDDAAGWSTATLEVTMAARAHSADLRAAPAEKIYEAVLDGVLSGLDGFSCYAGAAEARENRAKREGFGGIGVSFKLINDEPRISSVIEGGPAARAGLLVGDVIVRVDGKATRGMSIGALSKFIRGHVDEPIDLAIRRAEGAAVIDMTLVRRHVVPPTVTVTADGGIVVVRISAFNQETATSLERKLRRVRATMAVEMRGLVIDLRGNPGGLMRPAIQIADLFLSQGTIIRTRGRHADSNQYYAASGADLAQGLPIVVLIDGASASAAEILAAALQDRGRAVVAGTTSYGKGTVQTVMRLPNEGEVTLTWSRLIAPSGYHLHRLGVFPGICTSRGKAVERVLARDREKRTQKAETLARWRRQPHDDQLRRRLRAKCRSQYRRGEVDLEMAKRLIDERARYAAALMPHAESTAERK